MCSNFVGKETTNEDPQWQQMKPVLIQLKSITKDDEKLLPLIEDLCQIVQNYDPVQRRSTILKILYKFLDVDSGVILAKISKLLLKVTYSDVHLFIIIGKAS